MRKNIVISFKECGIESIESKYRIDVSLLTFSLTFLMVADLNLLFLHFLHWLKLSRLNCNTHLTVSLLGLTGLPWEDNQFALVLL